MLINIFPDGNGAGGDAGDMLSRLQLVFILEWSIKLRRVALALSHCEGGQTTPKLLGNLGKNCNGKSTKIETFVGVVNWHVIPWKLGMLQFSHDHEGYKSQMTQSQRVAKAMYKQKTKMPIMIGLQDDPNIAKIHQTRKSPE